MLIKLQKKSIVSCKNNVKNTSQVAKHKQLTKWFAGSSKRLLLSFSLVDRSQDYIDSCLRAHSRWVLLRAPYWATVIQMKRSILHQLAPSGLRPQLFSASHGLGVVG